MTQAELAERAGMQRVTVNRLETGATEARISTVRKLADALGVMPEELTADYPDRAQLAAARVSEALAALRQHIDMSGLVPASYAGASPGDDPDFPLQEVKENAEYVCTWLSEAMRVQAIGEAVDAEMAALENGEN